MKSSQSRKTKAFPLQFVLIVPFVLQIFGTVGLVGYLSFRNGQKVVNDLAAQLIDRTSQSVTQHLDSYLSVPHKISQINASAIQVGLLDTRDRETAGKYFWKQMQTYGLTFIGYGLTTGEGVGAISYDGKEIVVDDWGAKLPNNDKTYAINSQGDRAHVIRTYTYNHFTESWYADPFKSRKPRWSDIYVWNSPYGPYIAASAGRPIYDAQNHLLGVIDADIHLLKLSDFLRQMDASHSGQVFIMERNGMLVANSATEQPFSLVKNDIQRLRAIDSPNPVVQGVAKDLQGRFKGFRTLNQEKDVKVTLQGETHYVHITPWHDQYGLDWLVVVSIPENTFMAQINKNTRSTVLLCLAALGVASVMGVFTARWISKPIWRINQASEAMALGNLDQCVEDSEIQELNTLANSFNYMAAQLRQSFTDLEKSNEELEDRVEERMVELKHTLNELQRTQAQVIQGEKMSSLGQLVAGVAHEINNPVNFIHGNLTHVREYTSNLLNFIQLFHQHYPKPVPEIQEEADTIDLEFIQEDLPKVLSSMQVGTDRIRQIVLSLRNFSRVDEAEFKAVNIHDGIESTLLILQHRLKARGDHPEISIVKNYDTLPAIECYPGQLNQVFMNILVNAIDALEDDNTQLFKTNRQSRPSCITISTAKLDAGWVQVTIADNGPGIPDAIRQQIFNPFFTTKPVGKGTGLGMSISHQIVTEKHGGKLECFSTPGEGTVFIIQIPIEQANVAT